MVSCQWQEEAACDTLDRAGLAACAAGDQLLVFGGRAGAKLWADVLAYDTVARRWTVACDKWPYEPRRWAGWALSWGSGSRLTKRCMRLDKKYAAAVFSISIVYECPPAAAAATTPSPGLETRSGFAAAAT